ncbi:MAG: hypothetical protein ACLPN6_19430 [Streptosporangiaceae bacterium]|jgi:hypothetical protein|nr:hypothetical protein [Actinomycetota bacterium]
MTFRSIGGILARWDAPGPDDPAARVRPDGQPEPVEPFGVRGVAAEPGGQVVARSGPLVRAADPGGVPDRDRGGLDLLAVILGDGLCGTTVFDNRLSPAEATS